MIVAAAAAVSISPFVFEPEMAGVVAARLIPADRVIAGRFLFAPSAATGDAIGILPVFQVTAALPVTIMIVMIIGIVMATAGVASTPVAVVGPVAAADSPGKTVISCRVAAAVSVAAANAAGIDIVNARREHQCQRHEKERSQAFSHGVTKVDDPLEQ